MQSNDPEIKAKRKLEKTLSQGVEAQKKQAKDYIDELWKKHDTDNSGQLGYNEIRAIVVEMC